ncbi:hypothetical protein B0H11DRAFT_2243559 [Mycena galericulata]|nr:hypothetical protein B0H11DRAFT_2243559 [Mycena galericulata]
MLRQCSDHLIHLSHTGGIQQMIAAGAAISQPHITLESLESLAVHDSGILPHLTLPGLRHLILTVNIFWTSLQTSKVSRLLSRSLAHLERLSITFQENGQTNLTEIQLLLQSVPTVTDFAITLPTNVELSRVVGCFSSADTLPAVENLSIDAVRVWKNGYDSLLHFLRARRSKVSKRPITLKSFKLSLRPLSGPIAEVVMAQFHDLARDGLSTCIWLGSSVLLDDG